jgi:hypothetical protein
MKEQLPERRLFGYIDQLTPLELELRYLDS